MTNLFTFLDSKSNKIFRKAKSYNTRERSDRLKKTVKILFTLVMALALVIGMTSTVYAGKPADYADYGYKSIFGYVHDTLGREWSVLSVDLNDNAVYEPDNIFTYTKIESPYTEAFPESKESTIYDDTRSSINWKRGVAGVATFKNSLINLTVTGMDPDYKFEDPVSDNYSVWYEGPVNVKGTITCDGITYYVNENCFFIYAVYVDIRR